MRPQAAARVRIVSHEGLRGLAALAIALFHVSGHGQFAHGLMEVPLIAHAWIGVDLFFVLSGFVLFWNYGHRIGDRAQANTFLWRRVARLYPLHIATLFLFIFVWTGLQLVKWLALTAGGVSLGDTAPFSGTDVNGLDFFLNLALLHGAGLRITDAFNYPSWSVSLEVWMYLIFVLIAIIMPTMRMRVVSFAAIGLLCLGWYTYWCAGVNNFTEVFIIERNLFRGLLSFSIGVCVAWFRLHQQSAPKTIVLQQIVVVLLGLAYLTWLDRLGLALLAGPVLFGWFAYLLSFDKGPIARALCIRPLLWLGERSYSIYMLHAILLLTIGAVARTFVGSLDSLFVCIYFAVLLSISHWSYRYIEIPGRDLVMRFGDQARLGRPNNAERASRGPAADGSS